MNELMPEIEHFELLPETPSHINYPTRKEDIPKFYEDLNESLPPDLRSVSSVEDYGDHEVHYLSELEQQLIDETAFESGMDRAQRNMLREMIDQRKSKQTTMARDTLKAWAEKQRERDPAHPTYPELARIVNNAIAKYPPQIRKAVFSIDPVLAARTILKAEMAKQEDRVSPQPKSSAGEDLDTIKDAMYEILQSPRYATESPNGALHKRYFELKTRELKLRG